MSKHILLVEDDEILRESYADLLRREKYDVSAFDNKNDALDFLVSTESKDQFPDCILLDIILHDEREAGFQLYAEIRKISKTVPIIFLTDMDGELHRSSAYRLDADDFLNKNVSFDFLLVRIEALLRRVRMITENDEPQAIAKKDEVIDRGFLQINKDRLVAAWKGKKINLTLTQFWILAALTERPGHVKSHDQLMQAASITVTPNTVAAHIAAIRERLEEIDQEFSNIRTVRGIGYRWEES